VADSPDRPRPVPELRAIEALVAVISLFPILFATTYLSLSLTTHNTSVVYQHLDHTRALYFTIEVFSTVVFGDIVPRTNPASWSLTRCFSIWSSSGPWSKFSPPSPDSNEPVGTTRDRNRRGARIPDRRPGYLLRPAISVDMLRACD
jgi:hypothetical protein